MNNDYFWHRNFKIYRMKRILIYITAILLISSCTSRKSNEFIINGLIKGDFSGKVFLERNKDGQFEILDTANVENGKFRFKGELTYPDLYYIGIDESRFVGFFNEPASIKIEFNIDSLQSPVVNGSESDLAYRAYLRQQDQQRSEEISIYTAYNEASRSGDSAKMKEMEARVESFENKQKQEIMDYVTANGSSFVAPYVAMRHSYQFNLSELKQMLDSFKGAVKESSFTKMLAERIAVLERVEPGMMAPDITMNDTSGKPFSLSQLRGSVVLVDFWASWCGPCRRENPNVVEAYNEFKDKRFDILGVSFDKNKESWEKAIQDDHLTWHHVSDLQYWNNAAGKLYGIMSIPSNVLIGRDGKIIDKDLRGEDLKKALRDNLGETAAVARKAN